MRNSVSLAPAGSDLIIWINSIAKFLNCFKPTASWRRQTCDRVGSYPRRPAGAESSAVSDWVNEAEPGRIIRIVLQGLQPTPIPINGKIVHSSGAMVPWNAYSDEDIAAGHHLRSRQRGMGSTRASPVTPERVKAVREKVKAHPGPFTADELLKISHR